MGSTTTRSYYGERAPAGKYATLIYVVVVVSANDDASAYRTDLRTLARPPRPADLPADLRRAQPTYVRADGDCGADNNMLADGFDGTTSMPSGCTPAGGDGECLLSGNGTLICRNAARWRTHPHCTKLRGGAEDQRFARQDPGLFGPLHQSLHPEL